MGVNPPKQGLQGTIPGSLGKISNIFISLSGFMGLVYSKITPHTPERWKIPRMFHEQFMKEFISLWGFGEVWGTFPRYVGKIIDIFTY